MAPESSSKNFNSNSNSRKSEYTTATATSFASSDNNNCDNNTEHSNNYFHNSKSSDFDCSVGTTTTSLPDVTTMSVTSAPSSDRSLSTAPEKPSSTLTASTVATPTNNNNNNNNGANSAHETVVSLSPNTALFHGGGGGSSSGDYYSNDENNASGGGGGGEAMSPASSSNNNNNGSGSISVSRFGESWQTGITRRKRGGGSSSVGIKSKWKDPFSMSQSSHEESFRSEAIKRQQQEQQQQQERRPRSKSISDSLTAAAVDAVSKTKKHTTNSSSATNNVHTKRDTFSAEDSSPVTPTEDDHDNDEDDDDDHDGKNNKTVSTHQTAEVSRRTQFRRTASVPAKIGLEEMTSPIPDKAKVKANQEVDVEEFWKFNNKKKSNNNNNTPFAALPISLDGNESANDDDSDDDHNNDNDDDDRAKTPPPPQDVSRRTQFRRTASVPKQIGVAEMASQSPRAVRPKEAKNLTEFLNTNKTEPLLMNDDKANNYNDDTDNDGDSTIDDSWRPVPEKRRILAEAAEAAAVGAATGAGTPASTKTNLDNFLDALIFDAKQSTHDRDEVHSLGSRRRGRRQRNGNKFSSAQSVGSALDHGHRNSSSGQYKNPTVMMRTPQGPAFGGEGRQSDTMSLPNTSGPDRTTGVLWSRKSKQRRPRLSANSAPPASISSGLAALNANRDEEDLSAFLQRESKHGRPTAAHSVTGDRVASSSGGISIVLSEDGQSKTFHVGSREAKLIEKLLQATNNVDGPDPTESTSSMKGWLEQVAATLKSPSGHSDIANSGRVSTRSSLAVELSPPFVDGSLKSYLDKKRGSRNRINNSSAFTVAGDRVSVRYQGKSTQELLLLLEAEKKKAKLPGAPPFSKGMATVAESAATQNRGASLSPRRQRSKTAAQHARQELKNMRDSAKINDLHSSMPVLSFNPFDESNHDDDIRSVDGDDDPIIAPALSMDERNRQKNLGGNEDQRSRSMTPQKRRSTNTTLNMLHKNFNNNASNRRPSAGGIQNDPVNAKDLDLRDFRPPSNGRPTNRRTMMRKMHSVPILSDTNDSDLIVLKSNRGGDPRKSKSNASQVSAESGKSESSKSRKSVSAKHVKNLSEGKIDQDMRFEELNKSFLDQYLDGDVQGHDSASQIQVGAPGSTERRKSVDAYKASLLDAPVANSVSKLRIEPDYLDPSNRMILQDPVNPSGSRRDMLKKMKSVPTLMTPSSALKDLYESPKMPPEEKVRRDTGDEEVLLTPVDKMESKDAIPKSSGHSRKKSSKPKSAKKKSKSNTSLTTTSESSELDIDGFIKKTKSAEDDNKSAKDSSSVKKKKPKTPKGKKEKLSKEKPERRNSAKRETGEEKRPRRNSGKHKTTLDESKHDKKASKEKSTEKKKKKPQGSGSFSHPDIRSHDGYDDADKTLNDNLVEIDDQVSPIPDPMSPQTPNSERITAGEKQLRKGRKPRNPNAPLSAQSEGKRRMGGSQRWSGTPRGLSSTSPRSCPKADKELAAFAAEIPKLPFDASEHGEDEIPEEAVLEQDAPIAPSRKASYQPGNSGGGPALKSALKYSEFVNPPISPRRYTRTIPTEGRENTILECYDDDDSVVSDITDQFMDITEYEVQRSKRKIVSELDAIEEPDDEAIALMKKKAGSWADLSLTHHDLHGNGNGGDLVSVNNSSFHKSRRWNSMKDMNEAPRTPVRGTDVSSSGANKTPLGWLKKTLGIKKK